jgi:hypothetical protein
MRGWIKKDDAIRGVLQIQEFFRKIGEWLRKLKKT